MQLTSGCSLERVSDNLVIAKNVEVATSFPSRVTGLMGRRQLEDGKALVIPRCRSIHTCFMRFPIDVIFLDSKERVIRVCYAMPPWRLSPIVWHAKSVVELPQNTLKRAKIQTGDKLNFR